MYLVLKIKDRFFNSSFELNSLKSVLILTLWFLAFSCSCSTPQKLTPPSRALPSESTLSDSDPKSLAYFPETSGTASRATQLWSIKLSGYASELDLSDDGKSMLVSTIPNFDRPGGAKDARIHYYQVNPNSKHQLWDRVMKTQVKAQAISANGSFLVAVTHDDKMLALNGRGQELWQVQAACVPTILKSRHEIICYHDDDAEPSVAFDVYDWNGKKIADFPTKDDVLTLKVSGDERWVALALTGGRVVVLDSAYKRVWSRKFDSEIVDVAISEGTKPQVAVLRLGSEPKIAQKLAAFSLNASSASDTPGVPYEMTPESPLEQIGILDSSLIGYANAEKGQVLVRLSAAPGDSAHAWSKSYNRNAHYTPSLLLSPGQIIVSFEEVQKGTRRSRILAFTPDGRLDWRIEVAQELGAAEDSYLYLKSWTPRASRLAVAMDDGSLGVFDIRTKR